MRVPCCSVSAKLMHLVKRLEQPKPRLLYRPDTSRLNDVADNLYEVVKRANVLEPAYALLTVVMTSRVETPSREECMQYAHRIAAAVLKLSRLISREDPAFARQLSEIAESMKCMMFVADTDIAEAIIEAVHVAQPVIQHYGCYLDIEWYPDEQFIVYDCRGEHPRWIDGLAHLAACVVHGCTEEQLRELSRKLGASPKATAISEFLEAARKVLTEAAEDPLSQNTCLYVESINCDDIIMANFACIVAEAAAHWFMQIPSVAVNGHIVELDYGIARAEHVGDKIVLHVEVDRERAEEIARVLGLNDLSASVNNADEIAKLATIAAALSTEEPLLALDEIYRDYKQLENLYEKTRGTTYECLRGEQ